MAYVYKQLLELGKQGAFAFANTGMSDASSMLQPTSWLTSAIASDFCSADGANRRCLTQGYRMIKDFRRRFVDNLQLALAVYPEAQVEIVRGD